MKLQYANEIIEKSGMGDTTTCVYKLICGEKDSFDTKIIQYFIMNGLVLCAKIDSYVAHMFYAW